jgi:hypothetical protein
MHIIQPNVWNERFPTIGSTSPVVCNRASVCVSLERSCSLVASAVGAVNVVKSAKSAKSANVTKLR